MEKRGGKYILNVPVADFVCQLIIDGRNFLKEFKSEYYHIKSPKNIDFTIYVKKTDKEYSFIMDLKSTSITVYFPPKKQSRPRSLLYNTEVAIGHLLILRNILFIHGSSFEMNGKAFIFCGPSGAGKSTILKLAKDCHPLGDDTTVVKKVGEKYFVYPSPFDKKKVRKRLKIKVPLARIFILQKDTTTYISHLASDDTIWLLIKRGIMLFRKRGHWMLATTDAELRMLIKSCLDLVATLPVDKLYFTITKDFLKLIDFKDKIR